MINSSTYSYYKCGQRPREVQWQSHTKCKDQIKSAFQNCFLEPCISMQLYYTHIAQKMGRRKMEVYSEINWENTSKTKLNRIFNKNAQPLIY